MKTIIKQIMKNYEIKIILSFKLHVFQQIYTK